MSHIVTQLTDLLAKNVACWGNTQQEGLERTKLVWTLVLKTPDLNAPYILVTDASGCTIGASHEPDV
jgi:hypothetical protein